MESLVDSVSLGTVSGAEEALVADATGLSVALGVESLEKSLTTLSKMVLIPGEGTELYRGVGVIVLFGLVGTAVVTLTFLPALTMMALFFRRPRKQPHLRTLR